MEIDLYPSQRRAIEELAVGNILHGDVGSGKSRTALGWYFKENGGDLDNAKSGMKNPKPLYIITTAAKRDRHEWEDEMIPFHIEGGVAIDSWNNIQKYKDISGCYFIFDEQRAIGNGAWSKAFIEIAKKNKWIMLSATPGDNYMDYVPVFIANGYYPNRTAFKREHCVFDPHVRFERVTKWLNERKLRAIRDSLLIEMPAQKPAERHNHEVICDYDQNLYKQTLRLRINPWTKEPITEGSALCYALRRIVNSDYSRIGQLTLLMMQHPRLIVFYNFDYELELIKSAIDIYDVAIAEWNGHKHEPIPLTDAWVYLVQYTAGAEGWNCTQTNAMVFFSQNYSYKTTFQASGRIDRMNNIYLHLDYYYFQSKSSIDLAIRKALKDKKEFNERGFISERRGAVGSR